MAIIAIVCAALGGCFLILALLFAMLKERAAILISGFNTIPKSERAQYDQLHMSCDMRNGFLLWTGVLLLGSLLSWLITDRLGILALVVWLVLFFKDVHLDAEKAFKKYKK